ncbi:unnamed protein product [Dibothriocephalus latus]|uniref:Secreted RxLR effector peptide protein n=1 Tax=Dibothriocephalus latus TaxID=60516 RepID=A0A3P7NWS1_DIBLA|nr:unnamed protein product [Dibothriocephalus latus]
MLFRAALIFLQVLASAVLLSKAHPEDEIKEAITVDDDLLESALSAADISEEPADINAGNTPVIRPAGFRRRWRRIWRRVENAWRRNQDIVKPVVVGKLVGGAIAAA